MYIRVLILLTLRSMNGRLSGRVREEELDTAGLGVLGHIYCIVMVAAEDSPFTGSYCILYT